MTSETSAAFDPAGAEAQLRASEVVMVWDDDLVVRYWPGREKRLVLSFTGILRNEDDSPSNEFGKACWSSGKNHVLFITDMGRSYYSALALRDRIIGIVQRFQYENGITAIHTVGNSMGGYGAIVFSDFLQVRTCAAFVPAISLKPEITDQADWDELRPFLTPERIESVAPIFERRHDTKYFIVFGDRTADDRRQIKRIPHLPNVEAYVYRGIGHRVADQLKREGKIGVTVTAMLKGNEPRIRSILTENPLIERLEGGRSFRYDPLAWRPPDP